MHERASSSSDLGVAEWFREALETAIGSGDRDPVLELVDHDVEWVRRSARCTGSRSSQLGACASSAQRLEFDFSEGEWKDHSDGRIVCDVRQVYRMKESGEVAYESERQVELTIREGKLSRYELQFTGS